MKRKSIKAGAFLIAGVLVLASCGGAAETAEPTTVSVLSTIKFDYQGKSTAATVVEAVDNFTSDDDLKVIEGNKLIAVHITMTRLATGDDNFTFATSGYQLLDKAGKKYSIDPISSLKLSDAYDGEVKSNPQDGFLYFQVPAATELSGCKLELSDAGKSLGSIALVEGKVTESTRKSTAVMMYDDFGRVTEIKCLEITEFLASKDDHISSKGISLLRIKTTMTNTSSGELTMRGSSLQLGSKFYTGTFLSNASDAPKFESTKIPAGATIEAVLYFDILPGDSDFKLLGYKQEVAL